MHSCYIEKSLWKKNPPFLLDATYCASHTPVSSTVRSIDGDPKENGLKWRECYLVTDSTKAWNKFLENKNK